MSKNRGNKIGCEARVAGSWDISSSPSDRLSSLSGNHILHTSRIAVATWSAYVGPQCDVVSSQRGSPQSIQQVDWKLHISLLSPSLGSHTASLPSTLLVRVLTCLPKFTGPGREIRSTPADGWDRILEEHEGGRGHVAILENLIYPRGLLHLNDVMSIKV